MIDIVTTLHIICEYSNTRARYVVFNYMLVHYLQLFLIYNNYFTVVHDEGCHLTTL